MIPMQIRRAAYTIAQKSDGRLCARELMVRWGREGVPEFVQRLLDMRAAEQERREPTKEQRRRHAAAERRGRVRPCKCVRR